MISRAAVHSFHPSIVITHAQMYKWHTDIHEDKHRGKGRKKEIRGDRVKEWRETETETERQRGKERRALDANTKLSSTNTEKLKNAY